MDVSFPPRGGHRGPARLVGWQRLLGLLVSIGGAAALAATPTAAGPPAAASAPAPTAAVEVFSPDGTIANTEAPVSPATRAEAGPVTAVVEPVQVTGPSDERVDIVFVGDGYTTADLAAYSEQVRAQWRQISTVEPFARYRDYFNVWQVDVISHESGVDNDPYGVQRDTALDMSFWCGGLDRLLCVNVDTALAYAANAPAADSVIALANSTTYGGAGYSGLLATVSGGNGAAYWIALHEFGHSFGQLADEYDYYAGGEQSTYTGGEPPNANVSVHPAATMLDQQVKWYRWLGEPSPDGGVVSTYEGAMYNRYGIYRPSENSLMRSLYAQFNSPSREAIVEAVYGKVRLLRTSADGVGELRSDDVVALTTPTPAGGSLDVRWFVDDREVVADRGQTTLAIGSLVDAPTRFRLAVQVVDTTPFVRDETARASLMSDRRSWDVVAADRTPPTIVTPASLTVDATAATGAIVTFSVTATDPDDAVAALGCTPPSGSRFPIGRTWVSCSATDTHGNTATAGFAVYVNGAAEQLKALAAAVEGLGPGTSLSDKVAAAQRALASGDLRATSARLTALVNEVKAQSGKKIPPGRAQELTAAASRIKAVLGP
jgi:hypothetical protein